MVVSGTWVDEDTVVNVARLVARGELTRDEAKQVIEDLSYNLDASGRRVAPAEAGR